MASAENRRANSDIARSLSKIATELETTNHLLRELLKLELRHEDRRKGSAEK